jgi:hypothetical protein
MATAPTQDFIVKSGLNVQGTSTVTSSTGNTSTLQVDGGAAIAQNLIVGTDATVYGDLTVYGSIPSVSITTGTFTNLTVTGLSTLNAVTAGVTTASQLDVAARLAVGGLSQLNNATLSNLTNSTSSTTGALQVSGGVGIQKDLWVGGQAYVHGYEVLTTATLIPSTLQAVTEQGSSTNVIISLLNTASSTSTTTGALLVRGGVGIGGDLYANALYINTASYINNSLIITTATVDLYATKTSILAGTDTAVNTSTGVVTIWNTSTLESVTNRGNSTTNVVIISNTTSATSIVTGALQVAGGVGISGALYVSTASYINNSRILIAADLETVTFTATYITNDPTSQVGLSAKAGTTTTYGTYNFGTVTDISTINDYNTGTNTGFYSINDASGAPGYVVYIGFSNVTDFTRLVLNVNYTANSGHTVEIDLYNYVTLTWDTFTTYSGSVNWFQFILGVIDSAPYLSSGNVIAKLYHTSAGNTAHRTWIDYVALENSIQGGQGPRGATGAQGIQGPQGLTTSTTSTFIFFNTSNSTSTNTGAVVAYGGVGIGGNLYVGGTLNASGIVGNVTTATNLANGTAGQSPYQVAPGVTGFYGPGTAGNVLVSNGSGAPSYNNTLTLASTASSTSSVAGNALQVVGGVGIDGSLYVNGPAYFQNNVVFAGTSTYVYSTNTVYTDNLINLHVPVGSTGTDHSWTVDDGKDIGFVYHYYKGQDKNAFLGLDNATGYLEWFSNGEEVGGIFTGTEFGLFKTGAILLTSSTASNSTNSGALQVVGGVGIGGGLVVGGIVTSTNVTNAISSLTGALQVTGGVGIQQDVHIGGKLYVPREIVAGNPANSVGSLVI